MLREKELNVSEELIKLRKEFENTHRNFFAWQFPSDKFNMLVATDASLLIYFSAYWKI